MQTFTYKVREEFEGSRLDRVLTTKKPEYSRSYYKELITEDCVTINGATISKPSCPLKTGDTITVTIPPARQMGALPLPAEDLGVRVVYEHKDFLIVYKPAGLLVHSPNERSTEISLVDWLVHTFEDLKDVGPENRPGIVHRLDKETSGLLVVPRNNKAHLTFSKMFQDRKIELVSGHTKKRGSVDEPIGRDLIRRHRMAVTLAGRHALTHYKVVRYYEEATLLELRIITGRTHQIRVHCASLGHSILGDTSYGLRHKRIKRQALHAYNVAFMYNDHWYSFTHNIPKDMQVLEKSLTPLVAGHS